MRTHSVSRLKCLLAHLQALPLLSDTLQLPSLIDAEDSDLLPQNGADEDSSYSSASSYAGSIEVLRSATTSVPGLLGGATEALRSGLGGLLGSRLPETTEETVVVTQHDGVVNTSNWDSTEKGLGIVPRDHPALQVQGLGV